MQGPLPFNNVFLQVMSAAIMNSIYNMYFHPLSKRKHSTSTDLHERLTPLAVPGSKLVAATNFVYWYGIITGDILPWCQKQHEKYGEVVRIGSNKVSYINPQAWKHTC